MKAVVIRRPGGYEALEPEERPDPAPGPGQALVRVRAAGVNYADCIARMGYYEAAKGLYPLVPGFEFAGVVEALGPGVSGVQPGQEVFGITRFGGYAGALCVDARYLWPLPAGWSFEQAAAFPAVFLTAYYALFETAHLKPGETALVHSAAGGAGGAMLQLAAIRGCRAVGVVGAAHKTAPCRELGAWAVIDRSAADLWAEADRLCPEGFDAVFDANGMTTPVPGFQRLKPGGRLVIYGFAEMFPRAGGGSPSRAQLALNWLKLPKFSPLEMTASNRSVAGFNVAFLFERVELARKAVGELLGWIGEGRIRKPRVTPFPLERAADAHKALESGTTTGKLVLTAG